MAQTDNSNTVTDMETYREYILGVRIVEWTTADGEVRYRFEAPDHQGVKFDDPEMATLYADVYFDANGFQEAGTGERGVPPTVIQAGRDTLVAYFLTQDGVDVHWAASFYGEKPEKIERYASRVRKRSKKIRDGAKEQGHA
ncbi:hypothetical protein Harman_02830 [Haloarcula mannanilytica]|uniref:Uncharacterized protein n=1 Tax=Haloarcula mannanilytica TaxID=2509225 RepID=A0A4C2ECV0_9EURY|nr:hypothetical protein [Haloarcula mannanilytica]GCF12348.1 hypothetical protein Harman_02830 [Haloarcula mannanilytica]